jgi:hypothetical protein
VDGWPGLDLRVYTPDAGELRELRGVQEATAVSKIYAILRSRLWRLWGQPAKGCHERTGNDNLGHLTKKVSEPKCHRWDRSSVVPHMLVKNTPIYLWPIDGPILTQLLDIVSSRYACAAPDVILE